MSDRLVKCANCWHEQEAHSRANVNVPGACAAQVVKDGYSYPCTCLGFIDARYVKVVP